MSTFTHEQVWHAIDKMAEQQGLSPSGLAKRAGLDATLFNRSKRVNRAGRPRWPSTATISAICAATGTGLTDFAILVEGVV